MSDGDDDFHDLLDGLDLGGEPAAPSEPPPRPENPLVGRPRYGVLGFEPSDYFRRKFQHMDAYAVDVLFGQYIENLRRMHGRLAEHLFWLEKLHEKIAYDLRDGDIEDQTADGEVVASQIDEVTELKTMLEPIVEKFGHHGDSREPNYEWW